MSKPVGCWCIFCGEMVRQRFMDDHIWMHGPVVARFCGFPLNAPSPWSLHQGYWDQTPHPQEPLVQRIEASQDAPVQVALPLDAAGA